MITCVFLQSVAPILTQVVEDLVKIRSPVLPAVVGGIENAV
jgi:hypothetical protein